MRALALSIVAVLWCSIGPAAASIFPTDSPQDAAFYGDQQNGYVGKSVAGAGDVNGDGYDDVIVGAPRYNAAEGVAWIFLGNASGNPGGVSAIARLEMNIPIQQFGTSVAAAGDVNGDGFGDVIVGAPLGANPRTYVFHGSPSGIPSLAVPATILSGVGGTSVAGAGDVNGDGYDDVIVGSPGANLGEPQAGAAYIFHGSPLGLAAATAADAATTIRSNSYGANLGASVASAGDINGDGYDDVIVGAPSADWSQTNEGRAFVYLGSATGIVGTTPQTAHARIRSGQAGAQLGSSVAGAGDVNGDGYDDVIIGDPHYDDELIEEGIALIFLGSATGLTGGSQAAIPASPFAAATWLESDQAGSNFGISVASAGDVNDDGYDDVIVGAEWYGPGPKPGGAFIFLGGPSGIASAGARLAQSRLYWNVNGSRFGSSVAGAGDVNGDGSSDVIVGAFSEGTAGIDAGAALVYLGGLLVAAPAVPALGPGGLAALIAALAAAALCARQRQSLN